MRPAVLMRRFAPALLLLASIAPPVMAAERRLALDEAIRLALEKNDDLRIVRETALAAKSAVSGAKGAYDPLLELDGTWRRTTEPVNSSFSGAPPGQLAPEDESTEAGATLRQLLPTGGALSLRARGSRVTTDNVFAPLSPAYNTQLGVELRQPLLRDLAIDASRLSVQVAKADREVADASLSRSLANVVAAVERSYWSLVAARRTVRVRQEAIRLAEEQLAETQTRIDNGAAPGTEIAQPRAELERRRGELFAANEAASREENTLKLLILGDADESLWLSTITPSDSVVVTGDPVDVAASIERALSARPEVAAAAAVIRRRRAESAYARSSVLPSLDAVASYDRFGLAGSRTAAPAGPAELDGDFEQSWATLRDGDFEGARLGVVLGLPIPNRSARAGAEIARSVERQAEADLSRIRKAIRAEVLDAAAALETARQRIEATRAGRLAAEIQLAAEADRYESGLSTNFLVLTRQNDLASAWLEEISALTDYGMARSEMARVTGIKIEDRVDERR